MATVAPDPSPITVARRVSHTVSARAGMAGRPGRSVRTKTTPLSAGAGRSVRLAGRPPCTPTPATMTSRARVVWNVEAKGGRPPCRSRRPLQAPDGGGNRSRSRKFCDTRSNCLNAVNRQARAGAALQLARRRRKDGISRSSGSSAGSSGGRLGRRLGRSGRAQRRAGRRGVVPGSAAEDAEPAAFLTPLLAVVRRFRKQRAGLILVGDRRVDDAGNLPDLWLDDGGFGGRGDRLGSRRLAADLGVGGGTRRRIVGGAQRFEHGGLEGLDGRRLAGS